jgi:HlyD family secretion protein
MDGVISLLNKEPGEMALGAQFQQDVIMVVADLSRMEVEVEVDESDIVNVSLQDSAVIKIDAYPDTTFRGVVREIAHTATTRGLGTAEEITNFRVKITLLEVPEGLRPGMSATADIVTDVRENTLYVPIQCVVLKPPLSETAETDSVQSAGDETKTDPRTSGGGRDKKYIEVVFKVVDGTVQQVPVVTGITSDMDIEILSGLTEGETVVSGPYRTLTQRLKHGDIVRIKEEPGRDKPSRRGESQGDADLMDEM